MNNYSSTPTFTQFSPERIPYQDRVIDDLEHYDYGVGVHELLLSGSVGSSKSTLLAHIITKHCLQNKGAKALIARRALPDLRDTLYTKIVEHLDDEYLVEGFHYKLYERECRVEFPAFKSEIIARSWADKKFHKLRSLELSAAAIEELTENETDDAYRELKMRVGRLPHIKQNFIISATNPDAPSHWAHQYFIQPNMQSNHQTRHVYYSITTDNPFLPSWYIEQLKKDLDARQARRMIYGEWIEISQDIIYHSYQSDKSWRPYKYKVDETRPIIMTFDFNIGKGKPMSVVFGQEINDEFHWFKVVAIHGSRTEQILEECLGLGLFEYNTTYEIYGDATGEHKDTRSLFTDYDIIKKFLSNVKKKNDQHLTWIMNVPRSNPPVRNRHNIVNGYCMNAKGQVRFYVYEGAELLDKGMRLTALKDNGSYIEDDSPEYQHCTTAIGYAIVYKYNLKGLIKIGAY